MAVLGLVVGQRSTLVDDRFHQAGNTALRWLLFFTDYRTVGVLLAAAAAVALYRRRWLLTVVVVASPPVAVWLSRLCKHLFNRRWQGELSYPSGHTTLMVTVLGMVVLVVGARAWVLAVSVVWALLGMLGQAVTYHYFTDTVGAMFLGTSVVCVAAALVDWPRESVPRRAVERRAVKP